MLQRIATRRQEARFRLIVHIIGRRCHSSQTLDFSKRSVAALSSRQFKRAPSRSKPFACEGLRVACAQRQHSVEPHSCKRTNFFLWQGLRATEIDVVVTNMCTFAPTPSLSALLVHRFGMRPDTLTYSLARARSRRAGVVQVSACQCAMGRCFAHRASYRAHPLTQACASPASCVCVLTYPARAAGRHGLQRGRRGDRPGAPAHAGALLRMATRAC